MNCDRGTQRRMSSAVDGRTTRRPGYSISQRIRKRIEEAFGWMKTIGGQEKTKFRGMRPRHLGLHLRGCGPTISRGCPSSSQSRHEHADQFQAHRPMADRPGRHSGARSYRPQRAGNDDDHRPRTWRKSLSARSKPASTSNTTALGFSREGFDVMAKFPATAPPNCSMTAPSTPNSSTATATEALLKARRENSSIAW
jgi:hypothetical protein